MSAASDLSAPLLHGHDARGVHRPKLRRSAAFNALREGKALFYQQRETGIEAACPLAGPSVACNMAHALAQEGVQAFIDKRKPQWPPAP